MAIVRFNRTPTQRELNWFALIWLAFFGVLGAALRFAYDAPTASSIVWGVAVAVPVLGLLAPPFLRLVYLGFTALVFPIGWTISHVLMGAIYYGVVTPTGLVLRLLGRDPLVKNVDPAASTYWTPRQSASKSDAYFRQY